MPSPFPGVDPYLEQSGVWRDFHARVVTYTCDALNERLLEAKLKVNGGSPGSMPEVVESSLTRLKPLQLKYPSRALARNIEGWVEIGYTITPKGKVIDVKALNAEPAGVFEAAATDAAAQMIYKPAIKDGTPIAVTTKIRVSFRLAEK